MTLFGSRGVAEGCPPELELSRAISLGTTAALAAHLAACARCSALSRKLARPAELMREAAPPARPTAAREQVRTALLASLAARPAPRRPAAPRARLVFVACAAAAVVFLGWRLAPRGPGADRARPLVAGETAVGPRDLAATAGAPERPPASRPPAEPTAPAELHAKSVAVKIAGERAVVTRTPRADEAEPRPSPAESAFVEAWATFRAGRFASAALIFREVVRLDPTGPLAEDAAYWRAVSLTRTAAPEAAAALTDFVRRYPRSAHAPEASLMLGATSSPARAP